MRENTKLVISVIIDVIGMSSYALPVAGELSDALFAFIEKAWIQYAYQMKKAAWFGFAEEILPFTDIVPTCTMTHYIHSKKQNLHMQQKS